jgi:hypothetical protein
VTLQSRGASNGGNEKPPHTHLEDYYRTPKKKSLILPLWLKDDFVDHKVALL